MKASGATLIALVLIAGRAYAAEGSQLSAAQTKVLEAARASALRYREQLPDFICTQITQRHTAPKSLGALGAGMASRSPATPAGPGSSGDVIEERLTYVGKTENYEVVSVDGRKVKGVSHMQIEGGLISGGDFGSILAQIFETSSHTSFTWYREANLHGRHVYVFGFQVPKQAGTTVSDARTNSQTVVSFSGRVSVDPLSLDVLEITLKHDMPAGFPIEVIERSFEYAPQQIAGKTYSLPSRAEIHMEDGARVYTNTIAFKNYHRFSSESTIQFGDAAPN